MNSKAGDRRSEGERLHDQRRRRFWLLIGGLALIGFVGGLVGGFIKSQSSIDPGSMWLGIGGVSIAIVLAIYGSWKFFVSVDEVELADNLWGSLIGFYAYAILLPAWWALDKLNAAPPPDHWTIYAITMVVAVGAYFLRKILAR